MYRKHSSICNAHRFCMLSQPDGPLHTTTHTHTLILIFFREKIEFFFWFRPIHTHNLYLTRICTSIYIALKVWRPCDLIHWQQHRPDDDYTPNPPSIFQPTASSLVFDKDTPTHSIFLKLFSMETPIPTEKRRWPRFQYFSKNSIWKCKE